MGIQSELRDHLLSQPPSFKKKKEYTLLEVLGRGGFGKVVRATWKPLDGEERDVALKIIPKKLVRDNPSVVLDEINVLKGLDHPNIVHVWDHFESRDKYYLTFELAVGGELFDRITERGRFTEKDAAECIRQVVAATAYLHSHSIVHRDLKPENILYKTRDPNSQLVIADFGIAKHLEPDEELTCTAGSVGYAAPEVLTGKGHGMKVDLWSIGVIAYTLLCGYSPFRSEDKEEFVRETMKGKIVFHERYWKNVSQTAKDFIRALLQVDPHKRLSADEALRHPWLTTEGAADVDLSSNLKENFNARRKWERAFLVINASNRLRSLSSGSSPRSPESSPNQKALNIPQAVTPLSMTSDEGEVDYHTAEEEDGPSATVTGDGDPRHGSSHTAKDGRGGTLHAARKDTPEVVVARPSGEDDRAPETHEVDGVKRKDLLHGQDLPGQGDVAQDADGEEPTDEAKRPEPERKGSSSSFTAIKGMMGRLGLS